MNTLITLAAVGDKPDGLPATVTQNLDKAPSLLAWLARETNT